MSNFVGSALYLNWYRGSESNRHFRRNWILNPARLPVPPPRQIQALNYIDLEFIMEVLFYDKSRDSLS